MPVHRYFGRVNQEFGRPLWEIVMNLKNFGKGRLVTRSTFVKECPNTPSFYKIVSVHPHILEYPEDFRGNIFVEETFRGRKRSSIIDIGSDAGKADFELVHKQKEGELQQKVAEFMADPKNHEPIVRPKTTPLPPLWKEIIARERNITPDEVPEIPIMYQDVDPELSRPTRLAKDGEEPFYKIGPGHYNPIHKEFYEYVIWNREAAREKYCKGPPQDPDFAYADTVLPPLRLESKVGCGSQNTSAQRQ